MSGRGRSDKKDRFLWGAMGTVSLILFVIDNSPTMIAVIAALNIIAGIVWVILERSPE